jgi:hypothetical protein
MSFITEYLQHAWSKSTKDSDAADLKGWLQFLEAAEQDRARE